MSRHPYFVARMEPTGRREAPPDGVMRERRSRITLRSMRATVALLLACAGISQLCRSPPHRPRNSRSRSSPSASWRSTAIRATSRSRDSSGWFSRLPSIRSPAPRSASTRRRRSPACSRPTSCSSGSRSNRPRRSRRPCSRALEGRNIHFFLIDVPAEAFKPLAAAVRGRDALLFNVSTPDDSLRRELCAARIRAYDAEPRHAHGRAGAVPGLAQVARLSGPAGARCRRTT